MNVKQAAPLFFKTQITLEKNPFGSGFHYLKMAPSVPVFVTLYSSLFFLVWYIMHTQTREVNTMLHTTAMVMIPTVVPSFRQPFVGSTLTRLCARSVPTVFDISQVYFPSSSIPTFQTMSSWSPGVKWCLSVTIRGWSPFSQVMRGGGLPVALHCKTTVSPTDTTRSFSGWTRLGVSARSQI